MSINGLTDDSAPGGDGPAMAKESVEYWRAIVPDLKMDLSQEIRQKDRIAIEWLITGTHTGERPELPASGNLIELQGSAFLTLKDDKIVQVSTVFDALALAVQTGAAEAPAWWPAPTSRQTSNARRGPVHSWPRPTGPDQHHGRPHGSMEGVVTRVRHQRGRGPGARR
jgi:hypothetical protein